MFLKKAKTTWRARATNRLKRRVKDPISREGREPRNVSLALTPILHANLSVVALKNWQQSHKSHRNRSLLSPQSNTLLLSNEVVSKSSHLPRLISPIREYNITPWVLLSLLVLVLKFQNRKTNLQKKSLNSRK